MSDNGKKFERFGRYLILDHLVDGGMAKICRARFLGEQADRIVAIKMVQPQFSKDESFKTMFIDEIKLTFGLLHPNIVQTYDYGMANDQLYVAMEYCDGRNLKEYLDKLKERKFVFPVEISVYIMTQVCQGLHYAHTLTDKLTGKKCNIIHRDISPHNIMLTYDGAIKVIDFGIAKAETNSESTQAGTIKGKLSYLAPEYLDGLELDPRYDEFAVGITLWEMLCSRKLFKASNDLAVLKKIQECKIPAPSSINPNVPKELDEIVLRALSKDRTKRYDNLDQLNRALIKFLYATYPDFNATDLSYFAKELFKEEIKKDREKLYEYGKINLQPYLEDLKKEKSGVPVAKEKVEDSTSTDAEGPKRREQHVLDFGFEEEQPTGTRNRSKNKTGSHISNPSLNADVDGEALSLSKTSRPATQTAKSVSASPRPTRTISERKTGSITAGGRTGSRSKTRTKQVRVEKEEDNSSKKVVGYVAVLALLIGYVYNFHPESISFITGVSHETSAPESDSSRVPANEQTKKEVKKTGNGKVLLRGFDRQKHIVYLNGAEIKVDYLGMFPAPIGKDNVLRVQRSGYEHFVKKFTINDADDEIRIAVEETKPARYGYLYTSENCVRGKLYFELFGEKREENLPFNTRRGIALPTSGRGGTEYNAYYIIQGETLERKTVFTIEEDATTDLCQHLK